MGLCQSADGLPKRRDLGNGSEGEASCPTVFELERIINAKRGAARRLHVNLVNIEFRRGLFEVYGVGCSRDGRDNDDSGGDFGCCAGRSGAGGPVGDAVASMTVTGIHGAGAFAAPSSEAGTKGQNGGRGDIFAVTHKGTGRAHGVREVAVPPSRSARAVDGLWRAFDVQAALDHPNICRLQEIFCSEGRYYVVTDLCSGGDVMSRLAAEGRTSYEEHEAATLVAKIAGALSHCHSEGVVHGNLRVDSCHFEDTGRWADIMIVDAGLNGPPSPTSGHLSRAPGASGSTTTTWGGSAHSSDGIKRGRKARWYMPPEVRSGGGACTEAGDMWMLGALAWLILTGPLPQPGISQEAAWASIMVGKPSFKAEGWARRSAEAVDFVSRLLQKDAAKRMTMAEALKHPWFMLKSSKSADDQNDGNGLLLSPSICSSLHAFKESCVMRRLGLRLVGRTLEAPKLYPAKEAFRLLDPEGTGYITEEALAKGLRGWRPQHHLSSSSPSSPSATLGAESEKESSPVGGGSAFVPAAAAPPCPETPHARAEEQAAGQGVPLGSAGAEPVLQKSAQEKKVVLELFKAMDPEGSGRVCFSTFLAACLAGRPADGAGARVAFSWLDRSRKGAINSADIKLLTGEVLTHREIEDAFADAHDALDAMSSADAGPVGAAVREMEARRSAASGAVGGFTYAEFYRLLATAPAAPPLQSHSDQ